MATLSLHTDLAAPPDAVWEIVGRFGALDAWHPWVPDCSLSDDGKTRTIGSGAMQAIETLTDEGEHRHTYRVERSPMPITDYRCTWKATATEGGTHLAVDASYEAAGVPEEQATAMLKGFFDTAFDSLRGRFGAP